MFLADALERMAGFIYAEKFASFSVPLDPFLSLGIEHLTAMFLLTFTEVFTCIFSHKIYDENS